jgi:hypothetical protein
MRGTSALPIVGVVLVVLLPVAFVIMRRGIRGLGAMSDTTSLWAAGASIKDWRCGFDLRHPGRVTATYPLAKLRAFPGGFTVEAVTGRMEFAANQLDSVTAEGIGTVHVISAQRELVLRNLPSDAVQFLTLMRGTGPQMSRQ